MRNPNPGLTEQLERYSSSARSRATLATLRHRVGNWPMYAAVTGSAMATATAASANSIVTYTGPPVTASFTGGRGSNYVGVRFGALPGNFSVTVKRDVFSSGGEAGYAFAGFRISKLTSGGFLKNLSAGQEVSSLAKNWHAGGYQSAGSGMFVRRVLANGATHVNGHWKTGVPGFVGFQFPTSNSQQAEYGWAEVEFNLDSNGLPDSVTLLALAYDSSGAPIAAGDTGVSNTPEPGTAGLMLLALGAIGVTALRGHKRQTAQSEPTATS
jgi:hypothetical protein